MVAGRTVHLAANVDVGKPSLRGGEPFVKANLDYWMKCHSTMKFVLAGKNGLKVHRSMKIEYITLKIKQ